MKREENDIKIDPKTLREILEDYEYVEDIFTEEDQKTRRIKKAMTTLDRSDYIILCLYTHLQSERKVASILGCSRTPVNRLLKKIREKVKEEIIRMEENGEEC